LIEILETILLSLILFVGINAISARIRIESVSMRETLHAGDFVLVNKLAYKFGDPKRGDIVIFEPPIDSTEPYIKRIIGLPGDQLNISNGNVEINGSIIQELYTSTGTRSSGTWQVPDNSYFVMGDNRNNSSDSRRWGTVPAEDIIGKALFVYWPPKQWGALTPYVAAAGNGP
jgi:signal peptidase I